MRPPKSRNVNNTTFFIILSKLSVTSITACTQPVYIAQTRLHLAPLADEVEGLWGQDQNQNCSNDALIPMWLEKILSNGYLEKDVLQPLETMIEENSTSQVNCIIPAEKQS